MPHTVERLELPTETYQALEQSARFDGISPPIAVQKLVQERLTKQLRAFRREYQHLIGKELADTLTSEEKKRLDVVCGSINAIEMQSEAAAHSQKALDQIDARLDKINARFDELERIIEALPDRQDTENPDAVHP